MSIIIWRLTKSSVGWRRIHRYRDKSNTRGWDLGCVYKIIGTSVPSLDMDIHVPPS